MSQTIETIFAGVESFPCAVDGCSGRVSYATAADATLPGAARRTCSPECRSHLEWVMAEDRRRVAEKRSRLARRSGTAIETGMLDRAGEVLGL